MVQHNVTQRAMSPEVMPPAPPKNGHAEPAASTALTIASPMELLQQAIDKDLDLDKLERLIELYHRWEANEARKAYHLAVNQFKASSPEITKNETAEFTSKKDGRVVKWDYATLDHMHDTVLEALSKFELSHRWIIDQPRPDWIQVTCILTHQRGHSEQAGVGGPPDAFGDKTPVHAIRSTIMHLQRYTLLAVTGLAEMEPEFMKSNGTGAAAGSTDWLKAACEIIAAAPTRDQLRQDFQKYYTKASTANDARAQGELIKAKEARQRELK